MMMGIDVSRWQGDYDFNRAKSEGVEFVILKAGGGDRVVYKDSTFEQNYIKATAAGLHVGAYFYAYCFTATDAVRQADHFLTLIEDKQFDMPVYMDVEGEMVTKLDKRSLTDVIKAFLNRLEEHGCFAGVYASTSVFHSEVYDGELTRYAHWVAQYAKSCTYKGYVGIWQYGGEINLLRSNKIAGVTTDQNYCYVDYPTIIRATGCNGYAAAPVEELIVDTAPEAVYNLDGVSDWALDAVEWAVNKGIIKGDPDGSLRPRDNVTREEMCVMLKRALG